MSAGFKRNVVTTPPTTLAEGHEVYYFNNGVYYKYVGNSSNEAVLLTNNLSDAEKSALGDIGQSALLADDDDKVATQKQVKDYVDDKASLLQDQVDAFSNGEGKTYESLGTGAGEAMEAPVPADNTPFRIDSGGVDDGNYIYLASEPNGYKFISDLLKIETGTFDPNDNRSAPTAKVLYNYFAKPYATPAVFPDFNLKEFNGKYFIDLDEYDVARNSTDKIEYWVDPVNGDNGNTGLSSAQALRSLAQLENILNASSDTEPIVIHLADVVFNRDEIGVLKDYGSYQRHITFVGGGNTTISGYEPHYDLSWTADGNAYKAGRTGTRKVWDHTNKDAYGVPKPLIEVESVAECQSTLGSFYFDGTTVWVRLFDDRSPVGDRNVGVMVGLGGWQIAVRSNFNMFFEGVNFAYENLHFTSSVSTVDNTLVFNNCKAWGKLNGFETDSLETIISKDCVAAYNVNDGFNYHDYITDPKGTALEISCTAYQNGSSSTTTSNGSTAHDGMKVMRFNTKAFDCYGPVIADVNGCYSYNVGVDSGESLLSSGVTKASIYFDSADTQAWLIDCVAGTEATFGVNAPVALDVYSDRNQLTNIGSNITLVPLS